MRLGTMMFLAIPVLCGAVTDPADPAVQPAGTETPPVAVSQPLASESLSTTELDVVTPVSDGSAQADRLKGNARIGPATVRVVGGVALAFNDNINYSEFNRLSDFIITPSVEFNLLWPVTDFNTLTFDLGISYDKYLEHSDADTQGLNLAPDSNINFRMQVGKHVVLNFFDRFSYQQTPLDEPTLSNTLDYGRFENSVGVELIWEINRVLEYTGRYAYGTWISFDEAFEYLDRDSHTISNSLKYELNPAVYTGINTSLVITDYDQDFQNDNMIFRVGPFVRAKISENTELGGELYYVVSTFDDPTIGAPGRSNLDRDDINNVNFLGDITNRLNAYTTQRLEAGYESQLGTTSNFYNLAFARYNLTSQIFPTVTTDFITFYEYGEESGGFFSENFHRYGAELKFSYRLTKSVVSSLGYRYTNKDSDTFGNDYYQNVVTMTFDYRF
jgi:hypothetical protein